MKQPLKTEPQKVAAVNTGREALARVGMRYVEPIQREIEEDKEEMKQ